MRQKLARIMLLLYITSFSPLLFAGFATYSSNWPDDAATVDEKVSIINKKPPAKITDDTTKEEYSVDERISEQNRLYAKFGATFLTAQLRNIQNTSTSFALSDAVLTSNSAKQNYVSWEFGLGTKVSAVRIEAEYLYEKNMPYNPAPLFVNRAEVLSSKLMSQSIWLNLILDLDKLNLPYFTPYIGALGGFIWNKTSSTMSGGTGNGVVQDHSRYVVGWGLTMGARIPFWTRWFGYIGYKYLDHGTARWKSNAGGMELKGHYVVQGFDLGVQYLLG